MTPLTSLAIVGLPGAWSRKMSTTTSKVVGPILFPRFICLISLRSFRFASFFHGQSDQSGSLDEYFSSSRLLTSMDCTGVPRRSREIAEFFHRMTKLGGLPGGQSSSSCCCSLCQPPRVSSRPLRAAGPKPLFNEPCLDEDGIEERQEFRQV